MIPTQQEHPTRFVGFGSPEPAFQRQSPGNHRAFPLGMALAALAWGLGFVVPLGAEPEKLVQANFSYRTDSLGCLWDIQPGGYIQQGTNYLFSGGLVLSVNNNQNFNPQRQMMTASGGEFVLSGNAPGLNITRRIKVDTKTGHARYAEILQNPGSAAVNANISLRSQFNNGFQVAYTDKAKPFANALGKNESGVFLVSNQGNNSPNCFFVLCGPGSKIRPQVQPQGNSQLMVIYSVSVPPGKTVTLIHAVGQRFGAAPTDEKTMAKLFQPCFSLAWLRDLPAEVRKSIINWSGGTALGDDSTQMTFEILGLPAGPTDLLAFGVETRLKGTASATEVQIETEFGPAKAPIAKAAALTGDKFAGGRNLLFLRDGQILSGKIAAPGLRFSLSSGVTLNLEPKGIDRLVFQENAGVDPAAPTFRGFLETSSGFRLGITGKCEQSLTVVTPWGPLATRLDQIRWIRPAEKDAMGHVIRFRDGARCSGFFQNDEIQVETELFGPKKINPLNIRSLTFTDAQKAEKDEDRLPTQPFLTLAGENLLLGRIDLPEIHFLVLGEVIPMDPSQIRQLQRTDGTDPHSRKQVFLAELWGGGTISGSLQEAVVPIRRDTHVFQVPVEELVEVHIPQPTLSEGLRAKIAGLIQELGHPDWEKREAAYKALGEIGPMGKSQLQEAQNQSADPEVVRRIKALVDQME